MTDPGVWDEDQPFRVDHLKADLTSRSARGGFVTLAGQTIKLAVTLGGMAALGRLLTPSDFGLVGMVGALTGLILIFRDLGLPMTILQRAEISHVQASNMFWLTVGFSLVVSAISALSAPLVSRFYDEPRLTWITLALLGDIVLSSVSLQHVAILRRQMRYRAATVAEVGAVGIGLIVAVFAAAYGAGYWAIVLLQVATSASLALFVWIACDWRPGPPVFNVGMRSIVRFGGQVTGANIFNYLGRNLDNVIVGRFYGAQQLGYYSRASALMMITLTRLMSPLSAVAIPSLSRISDVPGRYRAVVLSLFEKLVLLTLPVVVLAITTSDWLVQIALGSQWNDTSRIFQMLGLVTLTQPVRQLTNWVLVSSGASRRLFQWGLVDTAIVLIAILCGMRWGPLGIAASLSIASLAIRTPIAIRLLGTTSSVPLGEFIRVLIPYVASASVVLLVLVMIRWRWSILSPVTGLAILIPVGVSIYALSVAASSRGRRALSQVGALFHVIVRGAVPKSVGGQ